MSTLIEPYRGILPRIANDAFVAPNAVVVGDVEIGAGSSLWYGCVVRGDVNFIRIGERTNVQDGTVVHVTKHTFPTVIGSDITIGHMCLLHGCTLEDGCFIGMRATVMDGVVVEGGAVVAAGSLVTPGKRVGAGELWAGSPARFLRMVGDEERDDFDRIAPRYAALAQEYRES